MMEEAAATTTRAVMTAGECQLDRQSRVDHSYRYIPTAVHVSSNLWHQQAQTSSGQLHGVAHHLHSLPPAQPSAPRSTKIWGVAPEYSRCYAAGVTEATTTTADTITTADTTTTAETTGAMETTGASRVALFVRTPSILQDCCLLLAGQCSALRRLSPNSLGDHSHTNIVQHSCRAQHYRMHCSQH